MVLMRGELCACVKLESLVECVGWRRELLDRFVRFWFWSRVALN